MDEMERSLADAIEGLPIEVIEEGHQPDGPHYDGDLPVYGVKNPQAEAERVMGLLRERVSEKYDELVLMDLRSNTPVTHRDVGIGVSQVLPVLVLAYADEGKIVAIEQPEIHLHPALQAELGDVFIESALGERRNTFLLETHSEHLILRILRRVRETTEGKLPAGTIPVRPEDVSVLFVEPTNQGSVVQQLPVTPDGDFGAPWPGGFFAERFQDLP
jgi:predicted ATPase